MDIYLRFFCMALGLIVFIGVFSSLVKRKLGESDSILWTCISFIVIIAGCFPESINSIAEFFHIQYPPTLLFISSVVLIMFITFRNTTKIAVLNAKVRELTMQLSIINEELTELKDLTSDK